MSGAEQPSEKVQRLWNAVQKAGIRLDCPKCGRTVPRLGEDLLVLPIEGKFPDAMTTLVLFCGHCGYVQLFAASALDQYMDPRGDDL